MRLFLFILFLFLALSCRWVQPTEPGEVSYIQWERKNAYVTHRDVRTTYFYVGQYERAGGYHLANRSSAWTENWVEAYGGVDKPHQRNGYLPAGFTPLENPFYCALPYNDILPGGARRQAEGVVPWYSEELSFLCKNRWVKITYNGRVCYAQWEDVGPFRSDDASYVFGTEQPANRKNGSTGLDVSPAVRDYLGFKGSAHTDWQFVDFENVPDGPWKKIITKSEPAW